LTREVLLFFEGRGEGYFKPPISTYINICEVSIKLIHVADGLEDRWRRPGWRTPSCGGRLPR